MGRANRSTRAFSKHDLDLFGRNWSTDCAKLYDLLFVFLTRNMFNHRWRQCQAPVAERPVVLPPVRQWERVMTDSNKFVVSNASRPNASFDPETLNLLSDAFEDAWIKIRTSGNRLARPGYANVMREVMAKHIFHLAQRGERDEIALSNSAVNFFTANYKA
jgi:hypothetical protein